MLVLELGHVERIESLTFAPDGGSLVAPCNAGVYIWREIVNGAPARLLPGPTYPRVARFTPDGRWLISGVYGLSRLDPTGGPAVGWAPHPYHTAFDVSPAEGLIVLSQSVRGDRSANRLAGWRADDPSPAGKVWEREFPGTTAYRPLFLPGGGHIVRTEGGWNGVLGRAEFRLVTYHAATGELVSASAPRTHGVDRCVSPDGQCIAGFDLSRIVLWHSEYSGIAGIRNDSRRHFTDVAFHPSGKYLAATSNDATVKLYDTTTWALARTLTWELGRMRSVAFSPDGTLAAAGSDKGQVVVWDLDL